MPGSRVGPVSPGGGTGLFCCLCGTLTRRLWLCRNVPAQLRRPSSVLVVLKRLVCKPRSCLVPTNGSYRGCVALCRRPLRRVASARPRPGQPPFLLTLVKEFVHEDRSAFSLRLVRTRGQLSSGGGKHHRQSTDRLTGAHRRRRRPRRCGTPVRR